MSAHEEMQHYLTAQLAKMQHQNGITDCPECNGSGINPAAQWPKNMSLCGTCDGQTLIITEKKQYDSINRNSRKA